MNNIFASGLGLLLAAQVAIAPQALADDTRTGRSSDVLAVTDPAPSANDVRFYDARSGQYLPDRSIKPGSGGLRGPTGIIFDQRWNEVLVSNQNIGQPFNGEIFRYDASDGHFIAPLISRDDKHGPYAPRGIVLVDMGRAGRILFIADLGDMSGPTGALLAFRIDGHKAEFVKNLDPNIDHPGTTGPQFHPRGIVLGPDGLLYVTLRNLPDPCGGGVVRFDPRRLVFVDVLISNSIECSKNTNDLQRPEGLAFGRDGDLYVTSLRQDPVKYEGWDSDKILIIPHATHRDGHRWNAFDREHFERIDLDRHHPRAIALSLVFGPDGALYVPVTNDPDPGNAPQYGEVRRYNLFTLGYSTFVDPRTGLVNPFYLSFGRTDPATLDYGRH
ncbi:hypothetical protein [Paraburkholderia terrae]|uniref:Uncharacterized protein n=1 Tax=Paraburkholderia terrae TaxID=311230 RepID=A0A2I8EWK6_9BURK|nr:hypothetical protein [Paraburkholderia terrae]AUT63993.1 hypothetical protein C2L65_30050 [Paraburkholderia terrae]